VRAHVEAAGMAALSTSANRDGEPPAVRFEELDPALLAAVDLAVDAGHTLGGVPSTMVAERGGSLVMLREGAVPREELSGSRGGVWWIENREWIQRRGRGSSRTPMLGLEAYHYPPHPHVIDGKRRRRRLEAGSR
jgi:hypothetical protein